MSSSSSLRVFGNILKAVLLGFLETTSTGCSWILIFQVCFFKFMELMLLNKIKEPPNKGLIAPNALIV
jgi:hypothetical protein